MTKSSLLAFAAVATLGISSAFAADKACCTKQAANETSAKCVSFATLNVSADQKAKLVAWQSQCMKSGCTKASHDKFLKQAKGILSPEQYSTLEKECAAHGAMRS
ncbi:MAG: hypothetical protein M3Z64_06180 [Verrucomicrobiota bacterium]|nr:hypothetical protein [Verrucomicrobiota bacterium]